MISKKYNFQKHIQVGGLNLPSPAEARQTINVKSQIEIMKHLSIKKNLSLLMHD